MATGMDGNEIISKVSNAGKEYSWLTATGGFVVGVTQKDATYNAGAGTPYYSNPTLVLKDFLSRMGLGGITLAPGYTTVNEFNPNIMAILNTGTYAAVGVWLLEAIWGNKYTRALKNVAFAPLAGYGIGRIFDDPPTTSKDIQRTIPTGNYNTNARNGLPVQTGAAWLG